MTIEEKANAFSGMNEPHPRDLFTMAVINGLHDGFKAGAEWMKDEVKKWIENYLVYVGGSFAEWVQRGRDDFEKFMMEE